jgi:hypothetical protein
MSEEDNSVARYQRPPRKGHFKPGQSGNPRGRPKNSKNIKTCVRELLDAKIAVIEGGKTRKITRAEAIAIQLVNLAAKGDPKGLAAVMNLTREFDEAVADGRPIALNRAEDVGVLDGIIARIRAGEAAFSADAPADYSDSTSGSPAESLNAEESSAPGADERAGL